MTVSSDSSAHVQQVEKLLKVMVDNGGTEMRLSAGAAPMLRIGGAMRPLKSRPLSAEEVNALALAVTPSTAG